MRQAFDGALSPTPHYYEIKGRAAEIARALGSPIGGAEHLFLGMLHDGGWPVDVISGLVDLGRIIRRLSDRHYCHVVTQDPLPAFLHAPSRTGRCTPAETYDKILECRLEHQHS